VQKKNFIYIGIGVAIIAIITPLVMLTETESSPETIQELDFTYDEANSKLKQDLESLGVSMSSPIRLINKNSIAEFCTFFGDESKQNLVEYCTSTELIDSEGSFLGNIHMVGTRSMPKIVLVVIQTNPFMQNIDQIKLVFEQAVDELVCDCWEDFEPSEIKTVSDWVDKQREFHTSDTRPTSTSSVDLMKKNLQIELSTNTEGYLWKLLISG
jgi:hypothetical protein